MEVVECVSQGTSDSAGKCVPFSDLFSSSIAWNMDEMSRAAAAILPPQSDIEAVG